LDTRELPRRPYRQKRRAESAEETRQRLVRATFDLHGERGIAATTMKDIAERADVSVGTVYHHFSTYSEAIKACGAYALGRAPIPDETALDGARSREERIVLLAAAFFDLYEKLGAFDWVRRDSHVDPLLAAVVEEEENARQTLAALALGSRKNAPTRHVAAMCDVGVFTAFARAGLSAKQAAALVAEMINAWLAATGPPEPQP